MEKLCAFIDNSRGTLIHRPRSGTTYNLHTSGPHVGIKFWCGMGVASDGEEPHVSSRAAGWANFVRKM